MNQRQLRVIDYLREENRVLREPLGGRRVRDNGAPPPEAVVPALSPWRLIGDADRR
jgi:hypothetical protein